MFQHLLMQNVINGIHHVINKVVQHVLNHVYVHQHQQDINIHIQIVKLIH